MFGYTNIIIKSLEGTRAARFDFSEHHYEEGLRGSEVIDTISETIPACQNVRFRLNGQELTPESLYYPEYLSLGGFSVVEILGRLLGGKGGFGTLLRGKKGNKRKVTNYDACRDLSGRRIRHARAVDRLKDWLENKKKKDSIVDALGGEDVNYGQSSEEFLKKKEAKNNCDKLDNEFIERLEKNQQDMQTLVELGLQQTTCREAELEDARNRQTSNNLTRARKQALSCDLLGSIEE